jgi:NADH-quinone oxidoreductase subunit N
MKSELLLTAIIFILLIIKVWDKIKDNGTLLNITNFLLIVNCIIGFFYNNDGELFSGLFRTNSIIAFEKNILNFGTLIVSLQAYDWLKKHAHLVEFYIMLLTTLLGMFFMISSGNLLMFYLGLELSSIPLAALCNLDLGKLKSSEAAVKMIMSSAFASGIMLFGISMLYGTTGTLNFTEMAQHLDAGNHMQMMAFIFFFAGFAFKLSAVPFHLWTADVYEGAPVPVTSYLSVISKGSIVFIFITILYSLFKNFQEMWYNMLTLTIILTISIGNLFAIRQNNIKRFLAFSSITQVGYILLGLSTGTAMGASSAIYFLIVYTFSNLGAFGVVSLVSAHTGKENISDYNGFYNNNKVLSWVLTISLFSLAGIPPTAGFFGKMFLVTAGASKGSYFLIITAILNMVVSLYYYLRIVKAIFFDKNEQPISKLGGSFSLRLALAVCVIGVVVTGFASGVSDYINTIIGK